MGTLFSIYIIIGCLLGIYWWNKEYKEFVENNSHVLRAEDIITIMIFIVFMWPVKLILELKD